MENEMKYKLMTYLEKKNAGWRIVETATGYSIAESAIEETAENTMKFMEKGGAFAGFTPQFMCEPSPLRLDR
jgi:hypothetical protein